MIDEKGCIVGMRFWVQQQVGLVDEGLGIYFMISGGRRKGRGRVKGLNRAK